jgi:hypothetical protein
MITFRKITRSLTALMRGWLLVICGVCLAIPLARLAALLFTAGLCLIQPARVRCAASASKSDKSHRAFDEMPALSGAGQGLGKAEAKRPCIKGARKELPSRALAGSPPHP